MCAEPVRHQARSLVASRYGIVATSQTLASAAGAKVLEAGGSAVDAAIAANAVLGLVEPTGNGVGGDLFAIVYDAKTGKLHGINASGWSPAGLSVGFLGAKGIHSMPDSGIHSVTVPGAVAGWSALHARFGKMPWARLFAPAIRYAKEGFPVTELIAERWAAELIRLSMPRAKALFLPQGSPLAAGEWFKNPDLAATLQRIALQGSTGFYQGQIAQAIVAASEELGGSLALEDLAAYRPEWVEPISTAYRGWTVTELPPNGQGMAVLAMLNILEGFPIARWGHNSASALHTLIEAKKLAYADMLRYTGDPRFSAIPVSALTGKEVGARHAATIQPQKARCQVTPTDLLSLSRLPGADTIYLSTVDRQGNIVSLIQSNYNGFGSGVVPPQTGFMLQNRGGLFTLEPGHPNTLEPRKRPLHTIIPGFMAKGEVRIAFGIMGGWNQAQAHAQFVSNVADHGMNIQAALEAPRFTKDSFDGCDVALESRVDPAVIRELASWGHQVGELAPYSQMTGGGQAVMVDARGVKFGASDPRKDGAAVPESPSFWR